MTDNELKPYPFCGREAELSKMYFSGAYYYDIICLGCRAKIGSIKGKKAAIAVWNRRAE